MVEIPEAERRKILAIAREVRRHVRKETGEYCTPQGLCGEASLALSVRLSRAGIRHSIGTGEWIGPVTKDIELENDNDYDFDDDMEVINEHVWIAFPDGTILDVTADQYTDAPEIWFPAKEDYYRAYQLIDPTKFYEAIGPEPKGKARIALKGPLFRRVHVREHRRRM